MVRMNLQVSLKVFRLTMVDFGKTPNTETKSRHIAWYLSTILDWNGLNFIFLYFQTFRAIADSYINPHIQEIEWWNQREFTAKTNASDNQRWPEDMDGPNRVDYSEAKKAEIAKYIKLKAWTVVSWTPDKLSWAFKCKWYPDGSILKFEARFCFRGWPSSLQYRRLWFA